MPIGSSIRLLYLLFRATFLHLCSCNRTGIVDVLLASRHHEYSGFARCAGRGFPDLILKPDMMERGWRKWSRIAAHSFSASICSLQAKSQYLPYDMVCREARRANQDLHHSAVECSSESYVC
jgi:hypothetical protein